MGTRFMCTVEAPIHVKVKQAIVDAQETDTELVLRRWKNTSRLFANKIAKEAVRIEKETTTGKFEEVAPYVSGKRGREVFVNGDVDYGVCISDQYLSILPPEADVHPLGLDSRASYRSHPRYPNMRRAC